MERKLITLIIISLLMTGIVYGQRKKQKQDTLNVYREFARIGEWYGQLPLQMNLRVIHEIIPANAGESGKPADMVLYYGENDFYMQAEGLEQIANDSLVVLVNNETRMIRLFHNDSSMQRRMQRAVSLYKPDSSFQALVQRYTAAMGDEGQNIKRITLQSREKVFGTTLSKETISFCYQIGSFRPKTYDQLKRTLIPVDPATYQRLADNENYTGRLVKTKANGNDLFFMVREVHTGCQFSEVSYDQPQPPVRQEDRIVKAKDGTYQPVRGFEDYVLSKEF